MPFVATVGTCKTIPSSTFEWKLCNFSSLSDKMGDHYLSPVFKFADSAWCLKLFPNGFEEEECASLYLMLKKGKKPKTVKYSLGIKGSDRKKTVKHTFSKKDESWGFAYFRTKGDLRALVSNKVLTIFCDFRKDVFNADEDASSSRILKVIHDMKAILTEEKRTDFTLKLGDREWRVHKVILEKRCDYFQNMFQNEWVEDTVGEVKFEDIEEDALDNVLDFIYTGSVENMYVSNVCETYVAAHRFLLDDLKPLCIEWMKKNMCVKIICKVLVIADRYEEKDLNESAIEYCIEESGKIMDSEEWKQLKKDHLSIFLKLLEESFKRSGKKQRNDNMFKAFY